VGLDRRRDLTVRYGADRLWTPREVALENDYFAVFDVNVSRTKPVERDLAGARRDLLLVAATALNVEHGGDVGGADDVVIGPQRRDH
jgi:hypothetical protein